MKDLLEYTRRSYEERFGKNHELKCVTLVKGQVCICIHSMAMNFLLYIADGCYCLEGDIKYSIEWNQEYHTYFLKCFYNEQILVPILREDCTGNNACYLEKELCKKKDVPFHYVKARQSKEWNGVKEEHLRTKEEKISDGWNSLVFYCKIVEGFRTCSDREYAERLLRSALFLFPFQTWEILEKNFPAIEVLEEKSAFIKYHINLLESFFNMSVEKKESRSELIKAVSDFLGIPIWRIWKECETEFLEEEFEVFLQMKLNKCHVMSKRFKGLLNKLESIGKNDIEEGWYKDSISRYRTIVNRLRRIKR